MRTNTLLWSLTHTAREKSRVHTVGFVALAVSILSSSTSTSFAKQLGQSLSPLSLLLLSELLALTFTCLSFGIVPIVREFLRLKRKDFFPLVTVGITNSIVAPLLVFQGLRFTQAANTELFMRTEMLFLFVLAALFLNEKIEWRHLLSGLAVLAGILLVTVNDLGADYAASTGDFLVIGAAAFYGIGGIIFKKFLVKLNPEMVIAMRSVIAIAFFLSATPFIEHTIVEELQSFPLALVGVLIGYGLFARFLNLFSFYEAMERLPVFTISLILPVGTLGSIAFAHFYLGEHIAWYHIFGGISIVIGSLIMEIGSWTLEKKKHHEPHLLHHFRRHA